MQVYGELHVAQSRDGFGAPFRPVAAIGRRHDHRRSERFGRLGNPVVVGHHIDPVRAGHALRRLEAALN